MIQHPSIKRVILVLLFAISTSIAFPQQSIYYNKTIDLGNDWASALSVTKVGTSNIIAATGGPSYTTRIIKIDSSGNIVNESLFSESGVGYFIGFWGSLSYNKDKNILDLGGNKEYFDGDQYITGFLMLIDENCDSIKLDTYQNTLDSNNLIINMSRPTNDGGYILVGQVDISQYNGDISIIKTDSLGAEIWRNSIGTIDSVENGYTIVQTNDNGYLIGAIQYKLGNGLSGETYIIKTDSLGNIEWELKPGSPFYDRHAVVAQSKDGNYIIGTTIATFQEPGPIPPPAFRKINIMKVSPQGEIIWQKAFGRSLQNNNLASILELEDGSIISVGYYDPYPEPFDKGWLLKVNQFGDSIWMREYWHFEEDAILNRLYDVDTTHDGGFVMAGQTMSEISPNDIQRIWLLKVDSCGCDTAGCDPTVGIDEHSMKDQSLEIFPNPTSGNITIKTKLFKNKKAWIRIYDLFGRLQKSIEVLVDETEISVNLGGLNIGLYLVNVGSEEGITLSEKILIQ